MIRIGILGLALRDPNIVGGNLGCFALTYSFFEILNKIAIINKFNIEVVIIQPVSKIGVLKWLAKKVLRSKDIQLTYYNGLYSTLSFSRGLYIISKDGFRFGRTIKKCTCVFDFTAGDSFTDLYGKERFYTRTELKKAIIDSGCPLILGSQTIGPFKEPSAEKYAADVIERCKEVYVRDQQSKTYVESISKVKPVLTSDVAFFLPYTITSNDNSKKKAGFNPSGLLWMGGYSGDNQFGLTVDYESYCKLIIQSLMDSGFEVHLIFHAYSLTTGTYHVDNDRIAIEYLHGLFPSTIVSPYFSTPMEAKSYISKMDLFIGARMHATIAALSAGIPVIPFSYSRKFEGLFNSLDYPYVVEGTKWSTEDAIVTTKKWISDMSDIKKRIVYCKTILEEKNNYLLNHYSKTIKSLLKK